VRGFAVKLYTKELHVVLFPSIRRRTAAHRNAFSGDGQIEALEGKGTVVSVPTVEIMKVCWASSTEIYPIGETNRRS
jgi:hypothetical protein